MNKQKEKSFIFDYVSLKPDKQIGLHSQPEWELSYIILGAGTRQIGANMDVFSAGEVVLIPPGIPHCWTFNQNDVDSYGMISNITVIFNHQLIKKLNTIFPELNDTIGKFMMITEAIHFGKKTADSLISLLRKMKNQSDAERLVSFF